MKNGLVVDEYGDKFWYQNDYLHHLDGPAVEWVSGSKLWYQNDQLHRLDGPAVVYSNGHKEWYIEDTEYSEQEFKVKVLEIGFKNLNL